MVAARLGRQVAETCNNQLELMKQQSIGIYKKKSIRVYKRIIKSVKSAIREVLATRLGLQVATDKRRQRNAIQVEDFF